MRTHKWILALAVAACVAVTAGGPARADTAPPTYEEKLQLWETISVKDLVALASLPAEDLEKLKNKRFKVVGNANVVGLPTLSLGSYYVLIGEDGSQFPVKQSGNRPLQNDPLFVTATFQVDVVVDPEGPRRVPYLQEAHTWVIKTPGTIESLGLTEPSTERYRFWKDAAGYKFATENCFRRFFILRPEDGDRLPEISPGTWQDNNYDLSVRPTPATEIEQFLKPPTKLPPKPDDVQPPPPRICNVCGKDLSICRGIHKEPGPEPWMWVAGGVAVLLVLALLIAVLAMAMRRPAAPAPVSVPVAGPTGGYAPPPPPPPPPTNETVVLVDGKSLEETLVTAPETVVLSPYALKVVKGGPKSLGKVLQLPGGESVMGRFGGQAQNFIQLDMSDRPDKERNCSREYVKLTPNEAENLLYVEVVNKSGNPVTVDSKTVRTRGDTLTARVGSHILLMPDWEFEVVNRA